MIKLTRLNEFLVRSRFFPRMNLTEPVEEEEEGNQKSEPKISRRRERALKFKQKQVTKSSNKKFKN